MGHANFAVTHTVFYDGVFSIGKKENERFRALFWAKTKLKYDG
jgi:hypothetical protein